MNAVDSIEVGAGTSDDNIGIESASAISASGVFQRNVGDTLVVVTFAKCHDRELLQNRKLNLDGTLDGVVDGIDWAVAIGSFFD